MKKVALSLAGLLAIAAFAPEASALPVFARQTGMACNACHFQHFPILNAFGRSFKASAFTLMGAQGKVEGEDLSLPDRLNFGVLTTTGLEKQTGNVHDTVQVPGNGGELSLFFGGKVAENAGFLSEFGASAAPGMSAAKLPMLFEVGGGIRAGVVFLTTAGQGAAHSFEILNTGASAVHLAATMPGLGRQHFMAASAHQYLGVGTGAAGASLVVVNPDMFFVNVGKYGIDAGGVNALGGAPTNAIAGNYGRAAFIFDAAGFNMAVGVQVHAGEDTTRTQKLDAQVVDFQMMGDVGSMTLLVTAGYGKAAKSKLGVGTTNFFNASTLFDKTALTINASLGFTPHISGIIGIRQAKDGVADAAGANSTDNAVQLGATYGLAQNIELSVMHTRQSGTAWNVAAGAVGPIGQNATSIKMEALF